MRLTREKGRKGAKTEVSLRINNSPRTGKVFRQRDLCHSPRQRSNETFTDCLAQSESGGLGTSQWGLLEKRREEWERKERSREKGAIQGRGQGHGLWLNKIPPGLGTKILEFGTDGGDMEIKERRQTLPEAELVYPLEHLKGHRL